MRALGVCGAMVVLGLAGEARAELGVRRTLGSGALQLQLVGDVLVVPSPTTRRYVVPTVWVGLGF